MLSDTRADPFLAGAVTAWRAERPGHAGLRHHQSRNGHRDDARAQCLDGRRAARG